MKPTLENQLMGPFFFKDSKWSRHKIETFRGAQDFFGPKMALAIRAKKVEGPSKSRDFVQANVTSGEEIVKSTLFCKVCYVLYSGIKTYMIIQTTSFFLKEHITTGNPVETAIRLIISAILPLIFSDL